TTSRSSRPSSHGPKGLTSVGAVFPVLNPAESVEHLPERSQITPSKSTSDFHSISGDHGPRLRLRSTLSLFLAVGGRAFLSKSLCGCWVLRRGQREWRHVARTWSDEESGESRGCEPEAGRGLADRAADLVRGIITSDRARFPMCLPQRSPCKGRM